MPLRRAAQEMRDVYANEIARAVSLGIEPSEFSIHSWEKYDAELRALQAKSGEQPVVPARKHLTEPQPERSSAARPSAGRSAPEAARPAEAV